MANPPPAVAIAWLGACVPPAGGAAAPPKAGGTAGPAAVAAADPPTSAWPNELTLQAPKAKADAGADASPAEDGGGMEGEEPNVGVKVATAVPPSWIGALPPPPPSPTPKPLTPPLAAVPPL